MITRNLILTGEPEANTSPKGIGINTMSKSNVAEKFVVVPEVVAEVSSPAVMTIVKEEPTEVRKLTLDVKVREVKELINLCIWEAYRLPFFGC